MKNNKLSKMEQNIINLLKYSGELNTNDLHARCNYNRNAIMNSCKKLNKEGKLNKTLKKKDGDIQKSSHWSLVK